MQIFIYVSSTFEPTLTSKYKYYPRVVGLSAKRLGGHLKKDKIIFQSSSQACCSPLQSQESEDDTICSVVQTVCSVKGRYTFSVKSKHS